MAVLRLVTPEELISQERAADAARVEAEDKLEQEHNQLQPLAAYIDNELSTMVRHRDGGNGWSDRLTNAMRVFNGQYDVQKLQEIRKFGGSEIYARLIATKCRGATSLLRDVYLNADKPWGLKATPDPTLPDDIASDVMNLVQVEVETMTRLGEPPSPEAITDRVNILSQAAKRAAVKRARLEAEKSFLKVDDLLVEGGFYDAIGGLLVDLPLFPFACIKGPVVRIVPVVTWVNGRAQIVNKPKMFWYRVSPFDVWWTPGVSNVIDAAVIERTRVTRSDLNQLLGLPGYNDWALMEVLKWYGRSGYVEVNASTSDTPRAMMESREDPRMNQSGIIDMIEYHGYVQGTMLLEQGFTADQVPDPLRDYFVDAFKIGRYIIKVQLSPSLKKRAPYYITSFEKVPGTMVGNALPDILADIGDAANAALRSLVNNMCLTGDTIVYKQPKRGHMGRTRGAAAFANRPREYSEMTLKQLVEQGGKGKPGNNGGRKAVYLRSMDEQTGELIANRVTAVHDNGVQDVFRITTAGGYTIKATATHRFFDESLKPRRVSNTKVGDLIGVNGTVVPWNQRQAQAALANRAASATTARGRKLVKVQLKPACEQCGSTVRLQIHHLDKDPWNCDPANLKTFCEPCHKTWHVRHDFFGDGYKHTFVDLDRVIAIEFVGREQTYCLTMEAPNHNFVANGFISHNSIASGPQVVVNDDRIAANEDSDDLYPWKRWHVETDPLGNNAQPPVSFFQPESRAQELLGVYEKLTQIGDELSAIPRYITGSERLGGAGRTASGLAMLMGNAAKILQTVASNIDNDVIEPAISELYDLIMLTDQTGMLRGDESIAVLGVNVAMQRETQRQRQLEFLQITANPIDMQITGVRGRANVLRSVSEGIGLDGEDIVPPDEEISAMMTGPAGAPGAPGAPGGPGQPPGASPQPGAPQQAQGPQTNVVGQTRAPGGVNPAQGPA